MATETSTGDEPAQRLAEVARILAEGYLRLGLARRAAARDGPSVEPEDSQGFSANALLSPPGDDSCQCGLRP
jgi:hypothetical protein